MPTPSGLADVSEGRNFCSHLYRLLGDGGAAVAQRSILADNAGDFGVLLVPARYRYGHPDILRIRFRSSHVLHDVHMHPS